MPENVFKKVIGDVTANDMAKVTADVTVDDTGRMARGKESVPRTEDIEAITNSTFDREII